MVEVNDNPNPASEFESPGGFIFGIQGWTWGEQKPTSITFFLDGTAKVCDQHGRPIRGVVKDGKPIHFAHCTHAQTVDALAGERIDWESLACSGWPQLPYARLKALRALPPTPMAELRKIKDAQLRKDAIKAKKEWEEMQEKELLASAEEE